jgi:general secretion pathway protein H
VKPVTTAQARSRSRGFTLIEIMIVVVIIGVISAAVLLSVNLTGRDDDGYQFLAWDARRGLWRQIYEDEVLRLRKLPSGLDVRLIVDARPVVLVPTGDIKPPDPKDKKPLAKQLKDVNSLKDASTSGKKLGDDMGSKLADAKKIVPQVMIYSNGDLSSFEVTLEREGGVRSITLAQDEKGKVIAKPMVETRL